MPTTGICNMRVVLCRTFPQNPQYQVKVGKEGGDPVLLLISIDQIAPRRLSMGMEKLPIGKHTPHCTL